MALPITDYTAFFAGAKQAVQELEQLRERELCLEESEKTLELSARTSPERIFAICSRQRNSLPDGSPLHTTCISIIP